MLNSMDNTDRVGNAVTHSDRRQDFNAKDPTSN